MGQQSFSLLACLLLLSTACCCAEAVAAEIDPNLGADGVPMALADVQCLPNVNGLYPVLDGTFDRFVACRNGKTVGRIRKCAADNLFSFGWQSCIAEKFMVAFDERALVSATTRSAGGEVSPASFQCAEYGNPEDPSIYYKNCSGVILNAQCDKGQTWSAGAGCVDTLGSTDGNAYEGYTRLANWDYKTNRMPCSLVNKVVKAFEAKGATKFVMKLRGRGVSAEFAFEVISSKRGINRPNGFGRSASVRIMAETNIKSLQIGGKTLPGFHIGYELRPTTKTAGDITRTPSCQFIVDDPPMTKTLKRLNVSTSTLTASSMIPAGAVTPQCAASGTVAGVSCVAGAACAWFTWGVCAGFAVPLCAATIVTTAQCIDSKSCFPADGLVHLPDGMVKRMDELAIGDKVLTRATSGAATYSDVYLLGHQDQFSYTEFVALQLAANKLYLSHGHFIPTASGASCSAENSAACSRVMKRAQDVRVGDLVWAVNAVTGQFDLEVVMKKSIEMRMGLYNPFTLSGDLVVNGVLASAHSDWFLDRVMPQNYVSQIPSIYQTIMSPMRAVYHVGGANAVKYLDANLKVVELASKMSL